MSDGLGLALSRAAPGVGRLTDKAMKGAGEMGLVTHAALGCDGTERLGRREHQALGHLDAAAEQVFAG